MPSDSGETRRDAGSASDLQLETNDASDPRADRESTARGMPDSAWDEVSVAVTIAGVDLPPASSGARSSEQVVEHEMRNAANGVAEAEPAYQMQRKQPEAIG